MKELIEKINEELEILNEASPVDRFSYDDKLSKRLSEIIVDNAGTTLSKITLSNKLWDEAYTLALTRGGLDKAPEELYYVTYLDNNNQKNYITYEGEGKNKRAGFLWLKKKAVIDPKQIKPTTNESEASLFTAEDIDPMIRGLSKNATYKNVKFKKEKFTGKYQTAEMLLADHIIAAYWSSYYTAGPSGKFEEFNSKAMKYFDAAYDVIKFAIKSEGNKLVNNYIWEFVRAVTINYGDFKFTKKVFNYLHDLYVDEKISIESLNNSNTFSTYVLFNEDLYAKHNYNDIVKILNLYATYKSDSGISKFKNEYLKSYLYADGKPTKEKKADFAKNMIMTKDHNDPLEQAAEGNEFSNLLIINSKTCNDYNVREIAKIEILANKLKTLTEKDKGEVVEEDLSLLFKVEGEKVKVLSSTYDEDIDYVELDRKETLTFIKGKKATLTYANADYSVEDYVKNNLLIAIFDKLKLDNFENFVAVEGKEFEVLQDFDLVISLLRYDLETHEVKSVEGSITKREEETPRSENPGEEETRQPENEEFTVHVNGKVVEVTKLALTDGNKFAYSIKLNKGDKLVTKQGEKELTIEDTTNTTFTCEITGEHKVYVNAQVKVYVVAPEKQEEETPETPRTDVPRDDTTTEDTVTDEELAEGTDLTLLTLARWLKTNKLEYVRKKNVLVLNDPSKNKLTKYVKKCSINSLEDLIAQETLLHPAIITVLKDIVENKKKELASN